MKKCLGLLFQGIFFWLLQMYKIQLMGLLIFLGDVPTNFLKQREA